MPDHLRFRTKLHHHLVAGHQPWGAQHIYPLGFQAREVCMAHTTTPAPFSSELPRTTWERKRRA